MSISVTRDMPPRKRHNSPTPSSWSSESGRPSLKRQRVSDALPSRPQPARNPLNNLSDELFIRILHNLPLQTILICQLVSREWARLASDNQVWKGLYYGKFVRQRALRIPNIEKVKEKERGFSSRHTKWLEEGEESRKEGVDWKRKYRMKHNWRRGVAMVRRISDSTGDEQVEKLDSTEGEKKVPETGLLVELVEGIIITVEKSGLRAVNSKNGEHVAHSRLYSTGDAEIAPTCLAVAPVSAITREEGVSIVVGFADGGVGIWRLQPAMEKDGRRHLKTWYRRAGTGSEGDISMPLAGAAYTHPYLLTIDSSQRLSLYIFQCEVGEQPETGAEPTLLNGDQASATTPHRRLLASLTSRTSWPPTSISLRPSPDPDVPIIAAIAYSIPTTRDACTVGLQELHISTNGMVTLSRLATSISQGFQSLLAPTMASNMNSSARVTIPTLRTTNTPTTISYNHPYLLTAHPDNTLTLYLVTSTNDSLDISSGTSLFGHGSGVLGAMIGPRGRAVSFSGVERYYSGAFNGSGYFKAGLWDGEVELRVWELESCVMAPKGWWRGAATTGFGGSVRVIGRSQETEVEDIKPGKPSTKVEDRKPIRGWVGFDDEVVVVLSGSSKGASSVRDTNGEKVLVYDFT